MHITNLNPDTDIGASAWLVELDGHRLLLDAGVHPKRDGRDGLPLYKRAAGGDLDAIAISHCHHDHVGSLPVALRQFPQARVLMPEQSYFLVERVLHNSVNVMTRVRDERGVRDYPLYTHDEVDEIAPIFQGFRYNKPVEWGVPVKHRAGAHVPTLEFFDAGHCLGSAGILVRGAKESLFYTGDVCFRDQTLLRAARFAGVRAGVLIMETTRGARITDPAFTREAEAERLLAAIHAAKRRKGAILIPSFALGRTQEILALLALFMRDGRLKKQTIHIGGLGRVFTEIYDLAAARTHRQHRNLQLHEALDLHVLDKNDAERMPLTGSPIFVITAGMMSENTAAHDLAVRLAPHERHAIFYVGYSDPDSPGGRLRAARHGETILFSADAGELTRRCHVEEFDFSAHANREELLHFVGQVSPRAVLLGHGDAPARAWFEEQIRARHPKIKILQPAPGVRLAC